MTGRYEAVVNTTDGNFRAVYGSSNVVYIIEEGVPGYADVLNFLLTGADVGRSEQLLPILRAWVYEMRRGLEILEERLQLRD